MSPAIVMRWFLTIWSAVGISCILITPLLYLFSTGFGEQGEVTFSTVSWLLANGNPLYVGLDSAERYSLQHGPMVYFVVGYFMKAFGPSHLTAKTVTVVALLLSLALSWLLFRKRLSKMDSLCLLGLEAWLFLHWPYTYLIRPDALMLLCVTAGLYFIGTLQEWVPLIVVISLLAGMMINLKIHGFIYFLPILYLVYKRFGARIVAFIVGISLLVGLVPFLSPQVSLTNYFLWLSKSIEHGLLIKSISAKILFLAALVLLPVAIGKIAGISLRPFYTAHKGILWVLIASVLPLIIIGSKAGSGTNHLIPCIPVFMYLYMLFIVYIKQSPATKQAADVSPAVRQLCVALVTIILAVATISGINGEKRIFEKLHVNGREAVIEDLRRIEADYAGYTLAIGYGEKANALYRDVIPLPVFNGNPYLVDIVAMGDMVSSGVPIPPATLEELKDGGIAVWLIPRGHKPFACSIFSGLFRETFINYYRIAGKTAHFDIWVHRDMSESQ